jgi:hypothetical protein
VALLAGVGLSHRMAREGARLLPGAAALAPGAGAAGRHGASIDVHGAVIDFRRRAVAGARVTVGATAVDTDARGRFDIGGVTPPYDVSLVVKRATGVGPEWDVWAYRGLTRSDPTLQVVTAQPRHGANVKTRVVGAQPTLDDPKQALALAFAGADSSWCRNMVAPDMQFQADWNGPAAIAGNAHVLRWMRVDWGDERPVGFAAYDHHPLALDDNGGVTDVDFDVRKQAISTGTVSARVRNAAEGTVEGWAFLQFPDGAAIPILRDTRVAGGAFHAMVPRLADATITVAATSGFLMGPSARAPFAVAHRGGLTADAPEVALDMPAPPALLEPPDRSSGVNAATEFRWSGDARVFVLRLESDRWARNVYVVTGERHARIPPLDPLGVALSSGESYTWSVAVHGGPRTVDEAAGPAGFIDNFGVAEQPTRPGAESGTFARSERFGLTTARWTSPPVSASSTADRDRAR